MTHQAEIAQLYIEYALAAFAKQHVLSYFNGKYLLPITKQPPAQMDWQTGNLKFDNGFTTQAQCTGRFDDQGMWHWAWADETLPESLRQDALALKAYGEQHHINCFRQPELPITWQQHEQLAAIATVLCGADAYHIEQKRKLPESGNRVFTLRQPELAAVGQDNSRVFHSHIIAEFAYYHQYVADKRAPYRQAVAAYLTQQGYDVQQDGSNLSARRGDDVLHYVFDENGRAHNCWDFDKQKNGAPVLSDVCEVLPQMQLYPDIKDVFQAQQASWLGKHLLPCFTLDLAALRPDWVGRKIHMLLPCEPEEGYIGEATEAAHNEFCGTNWLALRLDEQNRCEFLANEAYFHAACEPDNDSLQEHIAAQHDTFQSYRAERAANGNSNETVLINHLGGKIQEGNWTFDPPLPTAFACDTNAEYYRYENSRQNGIKLLQQQIDGTDAVRISYQGKPFYFICSSSGWAWAEYGADDMLLFYEPESRIVLMTFDYT
ncbi:DUF6882 domain-containing protein [Wielerella bovis]|uniref:DUF6882 domain-containing protein n=1 Tax=Wielerella bovis TaxID=2917790 RepID=UPI0020197B8C|nr:DUF6882 domain-containing protein [Wielerella bovis]ULJ65531.1 hypothetical protein MIS33_04525 [Wielerella bovis]ULJ66425.1 hypothetical protein MIS31_09180 [Wielerella bovis]